MKKVIAALLAVTLAFAALTGCSLLDVAGVSEIKYKKADGYAIVTELPNKTGATEPVIADEYEGLPVTEIADFAGCNLEYAEKITIGKNVKVIGEWAFTNNQKLREFCVPEENESFCSRAGVLFTKDMKTLLSFPCAGVKDYTVPDGVEVLRGKAFYKCGLLEKLTLPESLKFIGEKAFFRCSSLAETALPDGLETVEKDAFGYCTALTKITLPSSIKTVGEYAFYNCTSLLDVTVDAEKDAVSFGKDWQPTNNGLAIDELKINYKN